MSKKLYLIGATALCVLATAGMPSQAYAHDSHRGHDRHSERHDDRHKHKAHKKHKHNHKKASFIHRRSKNGVPVYNSYYYPGGYNKVVYYQPRTHYPVRTYYPNNSGLTLSFNFD